MTLGIAHILPTFGMGGQERVALDLAVGQKARGHRVLGVSLSEGTSGPLADEFRAHGIDVETCTKWPRSFGIDLSLPPRLAMLLRHARVDVVHTHNPQPLIYGAPAGKLAGCATVHTRHGENRDPRWRARLRRLSGRLADVYVCVSEETASIAQKENDARYDKIRVIKNGIDLSRFDPERPLRAEVRHELGIGESAFVVGTVGRVVADKHQAMLVEAMRPLCADGAELVIVGDGDLLRTLRAEVDKSPDAKRMHLLGVRRDAPRILQALDAFALSSRSEGLPLVILEAMATALPIVATSVGGIPGVISDGHTGLLVPANDASALTGALRRLHRDRELAHRIGSAARTEALAEYSADAMVEHYLELYAQLRA